VEARFRDLDRARLARRAASGASGAGAAFLGLEVRDREVRQAHELRQRRAELVPAPVEDVAPMY
jgi:hypothetical protein